jgi:outer membrane protein assembly factor BamB
MKDTIFLLCVVAATVTLLSTSRLVAADWPQWRGPQRNGVSAETGLLEEWPKEGPRLVGKIGSGYSTPAVVGQQIYLLANQGLDNEFVQARAVADGGPIWSTRIGKVGNPDQQPNYPAARSTPTVDGRFLYVLGSDGDLALVEATPQAYREKGRFTPPDQPDRGRSKAWAYPVVANGRLYIRDLDVLWSYDVRKP